MNKDVKKLTQSVILAALGILIPLFMPFPFKILIGDAASYTLASHLPLFLAIFIAPQVTILTGLGITFGFLASLGPVVAARAFSHLFWAVPLAYLYKKHRARFMTLKTSIIISILVGLIHALLEVIVVIPFYTDGLSFDFFLKTLFIPIGIGGFIHSNIDFILSMFVFKRIEFVIFPESDTEKPIDSSK